VAGVSCLATAGPEDQLDAIAVDDASVYWVALGQTAAASRLLKKSRSGGSPVTIVQTLGTSLPESPMVSDGSSLYWGSASAIVEVPVSGGPVVTLAPASFETCVAVDADNVYWTELSSDGSVVLRVPKGGGAVETIASVTGNTAIVPFAIGLDETRVYWEDGALFSVDKSGGSVTTVLGGSGTTSDAGLLPRGCKSIVIDSGSAFLIDRIGSASDLVSVPLAGGAAPSPLATVGSPLIVADSQRVAWWLVEPALVIQSISLDGGTPSVIAMPQAQSIDDMAIASDGTLYWVTGQQVQSASVR
jgi:hypothetical protein